MSNNERRSKISQKELANKLNELISKEKQNKSKNVPNKYIQRQISKNQKQPLGDKRQDITSHKEMVNNHIAKELEFKRVAKNWSIIIFLCISLIIIANLIILLYWNPAHLSDKVIIVLTTVTFANLFTIIMVIFKYVFSPTKEMLDYNSNFYNHEDD
ncbi:hypothetical protein [Staphylococcus hominis]|uniref:hypothetical protein n=1 Tax=Staphylococcus hominis TaxID=1290 RepID=UPI0003122250|nr:hypothetical protein [Staphylococcus hominis]